MESGKLKQFMESGHVAYCHSIHLSNDLMTQERNYMNEIFWATVTKSGQRDFIKSLKRKLYRSALTLLLFNIRILFLRQSSQVRGVTSTSPLTMGVTQQDVEGFNQMKCNSVHQNPKWLPETKVKNSFLNLNLNIPILHDDIKYLKLGFCEVVTPLT